MKKLFQNKKESKPQKINIGCGQTPTLGWLNFDNSFSIKIAKIPMLYKVAYKLGILKESQYQFIQFAKKNKIKHGDVIKGLPLADESIDVVYSSHMIEHLDFLDVKKFLNEVYRILVPKGIVRIATPDLDKLVDHYNETGDANYFIKSTRLYMFRPKSFLERIKILLIGTRHHLWLYNKYSLANLLKNHGFINPEVMQPGDTKIKNPGFLNLKERSKESLYIEAEKTE